MTKEHMEQNAHVNADDSVFEIKTSFDAKCKKVLSYKQVIAYIMRGCLKEFYDISMRDIADSYIIDMPLVGTAPVMPDASVLIGPAEDTSAKEGSIFFDVKCTARTPLSGTDVGMIINLEAQDRFKPGYWLPTRGIYYVCRLISGQYGVFFLKSDYGSLVHVVSVWICTNPAEGFENTITRFSIKPEQLFGAAEYPNECYDLITIIMVCLGHAPEDDSKTPRVIKLLRALLTAKTTREEKEKYLREEFPDFVIDDEMKGDFDSMCNLSDGIYNSGRVEGRIEGRAGAFYDMVIQNAITPVFAASQLCMTEAEFTRQFTQYMENH